MIARRMPDALKAAQIVLSVAAAIAIPSCHRRAAGPVVTLAHPNGLVLKVPEVIDGRGFAFVQTPAGFAYADPRDVRTEIVGNAVEGAASGVGNRSLVLFDRGDEVVVEAGEMGIRFLLVSGKPIEEPVAWYGPIVMNTEEELRRAYDELRQGTFIQR